ncbi:MAG TPA: radical SAM protein [candidate division Zixibacteria bacterium]|nr:radical SAM protein [candidate division Zixibacteria bacterium]
MKPSVLLAYPSSFNCSTGIDDVDVKTSLLVLGSYISEYYPVEYMDFEIAVGRPNSRIQIKRFRRKVREYFESHSFDILGLSCWTSMSYLAALMVAEIFRELHPDKLIVVGGYHPTARPDEFVSEDQLFDYVVTGEGERAFHDIIDEHASNGKRPEKTTVVHGATTKAAEFVPYNWNLVDSFVRQHFSNGLPKLYVYLSRGCPFDCSFCMESLKDRRWRSLTPTQAVDLIEDAANRYNPQIVGIADACFGLRPAWRKEFLKLLAATKPSYQVIFETRAEYMDEADIELLTGMNVEVQFGVESGSPKILQLMHKTKQPGKYLDRFRGISRMLSERRILHRANIIFNHPGETEETLNETMSVIDSLLDVPESYLMWVCRQYMHYPGCELDRNRTFYEQEFGSQFLSPEWWREDRDQYEGSLDSYPSGDLTNGRQGLWGDLLSLREERFRCGLADDAFRYAAEKYFPEWLNDPRYQQI